MSHVTVHRVWQRAGLQPHRLEGYVTSDDPDFEAKAADVIGLYLKPPANAVVFSLDEKSQIQALDRLAPVLPLSPGRVERHGFEYQAARDSHHCGQLRGAQNGARHGVVGRSPARAPAFHTDLQLVVESSRALVAKIERDMIARGIFSSTADLRRKLMQYIRAHNKTCQPIEWSDSDVKHRIRAPPTSVTRH